MGTKATTYGETRTPLEKLSPLMPFPTMRHGNLLRVPETPPSPIPAVTTIVELKHASATPHRITCRFQAHPSTLSPFQQPAIGVPGRRLKLYLGHNRPSIPQRGRPDRSPHHEDVGERKEISRTHANSSLTNSSFECHYPVRSPGKDHLQVAGV